MEYLREYKNNVDHLVKWCNDMTATLNNLSCGLLELQDTINVFSQENKDKEATVPQDLQDYLVDYCAGIDEIAGDSVNDNAAPQYPGITDEEWNNPYYQKTKEYLERWKETHRDN